MQRLCSDEQFPILKETKRFGSAICDPKQSLRDSLVAACHLHPMNRAINQATHTRNVVKPSGSNVIRALNCCAGVMFQNSMKVLMVPIAYARTHISARTVRKVINIRLLLQFVFQ